MTAFRKMVRMLALAMAYCGGALLLAISAMIVVSVSGRALIFLGAGPVSGDFELVEIGIGAAVCAFLPWVHLTNGHASVGLVTDYFGNRFNTFITFVVQIGLLAAATFLLITHWNGVLDKTQYGEVTFVLKFPVWWGYATFLPGLLVWVLVSIQSVLDAAEDLVSVWRAQEPTVAK